MRAATIRDGEVLVEEHPDPVPGAGEVLVRVRAAGLNGADQLQRRGAYPAPAGSPPDIPGLELAGEVAGLGPAATRFAEGDRVMAIVGGGGQGELCTVHERQLMAVPAGLEWAQAGGLPEVFTTAHDALFTQAHLGMGERVLISGAGGGVGTAAVQLAAAAGAHVTASVRNAGLRSGVSDLGAHVVLDPAESAEGGPYDVLLELVGASNLDANFGALATDGRAVVIGVGGGGFESELNLLALMGRRASIRASTLRARPLEEKAATARAMERHVLGLVERGSVRVPVAAAYPLEAVADAYEHFAAGGKLGKIVLEIGLMAGNSVARFWQARASGDWEGLAAQLRPGVTIQMVHEDEEMNRDEFLTFLRVMHHDATTKVDRIVTGRGLQIAVLASVSRPEMRLECAGFYDLREGRIAMLREMWLPRGGTSVLDLV